MKTKTNIIVERPSERQIHFNYSPRLRSIKAVVEWAESAYWKKQGRGIFLRKNVNTLSMYAIIMVEKNRAEAGRKIPLYKKLKLIKIFLL